MKNIIRLYQSNQLRMKTVGGNDLIEASAHRPDEPRLYEEAKKSGVG